MSHTQQSKKRTVVIPFSALNQEEMSDSDSEPLLDQLGDATNDTINSSSPPSVLGEQSISGEMADPESDDDTLKNMKLLGMQTEDDYENPQELNLAKEIEKGEKLHRRS